MHVIYWFRSDLRLHYNNAVRDAIEASNQAQSEGASGIHFIYIIDSLNPLEKTGAAHWWLTQSLKSLSQRIEKLGAKLTVYEGSSIAVFKTIVNDNTIDRVYFSHDYTPFGTKLESDLKQNISSKVQWTGYHQSLLTIPNTILSKTGTPYKVFTPFYHSLKSRYHPITEQTLDRECQCRTLQLQSTTFEFHINDKDVPWQKKIQQYLQPGELNAINQASDFIDDGIAEYQDNRNFPAIDGTSSLSMHLAFGEISPHYLFKKCKQANSRDDDHSSTEPFTRQLAWRDFNNHLLFHFPKIIHQPFQHKFSRLTYQTNEHDLIAWQQGKTGYPIVDAGMRQLWQTGWMHNRVRMIVASFLTKHLLISWKEGAKWFWQTLADADVANNIGGWQWVAGSGADAAPYFRIFNPTLQSIKFDKSGEYLRQWLPELRQLSDKGIHQPVTAKKDDLDNAGVILGKSYPLPIIDHSFARDRALEHFQKLKDPINQV